MIRRVLILSLCSQLFYSCRTIKQFDSVVNTRTDTLYESVFVRDSIYVADSVVLREKGDTIFSERWHTKYIERLRTDTIYESKNDSIYVERVIEYKMTRLERVKYFMTDAGILLVSFGVVWLLILLLKWLAKTKSGL